MHSQADLGTPISPFQAARNKPLNTQGAKYPIQLPQPCSYLRYQIGVSEISTNKTRTQGSNLLLKKNTMKLA